MIWKDYTGIYYAIANDKNPFRVTLEDGILYSTAMDGRTKQSFTIMEMYLKELLSLAKTKVLV